MAAAGGYEQKLSASRRQERNLPIPRELHTQTVPREAAKKSPYQTINTFQQNMQFPCLLPFKSIPEPEIVIWTTERKLIWQNTKAALLSHEDLSTWTRLSQLSRAGVEAALPVRNVFFFPGTFKFYFSSLQQPAWFLFHQSTDTRAVCSQDVSFSSSDLKEKSIHLLALCSYSAFGTKGRNALFGKCQNEMHIIIMEHIL